MKRFRLLTLLALLITAATGAWAQTTYTVAGSTEAMFGTAWDASNTANDMTKNGDGTYSITYTNVYLDEGEVQYKVVKDHSWSESYPNANRVISIAEAGTYTLTICFNPTTHEVYEKKPGYTVSLKEGTVDAKNWTIASGEKSATGDAADGLPGLSEGDQVTVTYTGTRKVIGVKATSDAAPAEETVTLATPLTIEAITPGTIVVNMTDELSTGMKYSVNGGTKTTIYNTTDITVAKGDKVQFYGNGTQTQAYGDAPEVRIQGSGNGFQTKVYGNIMSLLDEEGFATKTDLPNASYVFYGLFADNSTLIDASELLLPATTLTPACYRQMFDECTSLTTAPKLPATTLATQCYCFMFGGCESLTSAYVKAAYTEGDNMCVGMFNGSMATGAVLHTTPGSKASWEEEMGPDKTWDNWSVAGDWQE